MHHTVKMVLIFQMSFIKSDQKEINKIVRPGLKFGKESLAFPFQGIGSVVRSS